jgi:hypothetical protein
LFEAGQDSAEATGAADNDTDELVEAVDDTVKLVVEALLPEEPPETLTAEIVLLPELV